MDDETALIRRARDGDAGAYGELVRLHGARLLGQARALCRNDALGEDLAQETFIEAWKSIARFNFTCRFSTWLYAILMNRFRKHLRRTASRPEVALPERLEPEAAGGNDPAEALREAESAGALRRRVDELPEAQAEVIRLRFYADARLQEIAELLGVSEGTVKSRLFYGLAALRKKVKSAEPLAGGTG